MVDITCNFFICFLKIDEVFEEPCTDSLQTIADLLEQKEPSTEKSSGTDDEIEKHQIPLPEYATPTHKSPHQKFLQVFNQCKELHAWEIDKAFMQKVVLLLYFTIVELSFFSLGM